MRGPVDQRLGGPEGIPFRAVSGGGWQPRVAGGGRRHRVGLAILGRPRPSRDARPYPRMTGPVIPTPTPCPLPLNRAGPGRFRALVTFRQDRESTCDTRGLGPHAS